MYVYVYVCVCVNVNVTAHVHVNVNVNVCMYVYLYAYICILYTCIHGSVPQRGLVTFRATRATTGNGHYIPLSRILGSAVATRIRGMR